MMLQGGQIWLKNGEYVISWHSVAVFILLSTFGSGEFVNSTVL